MSYTSSLLTPGIRVATLENSSTKGIDYRTDFEQLLEFHDEIYTAHFNSGNKYYKALLESDEIFNEGVFGAISGFISIIINTIRSMFNMIFGGKSSDDSAVGKAVNTISGKVSEAISKNRKNIKERQKTFNSMYQDGKLNGKKASMRVYSFGLSTGKLIEINENTVIPNSDILQAINACTNKFDTMIGLIKAKGGVAVRRNDDNLEQTTKSYNQIVEDMTAAANQLKGLKPNEYAIFKPNKEEVTADTVYQYSTRVNLYDDFNNQLTKYNEKNFPAIATGLKKLEDIGVILDKQEGTADDKIKQQIDLTRQVLDAYNLILSKYMTVVKNFVDSAKVAMSNQYDDLSRAISTMISNGLNSSDTVGGEVAEQAQFEASILDEQFSNSLAATMYDLKWSYMDAYRQGYVNEAVIRAENKDVDTKLIKLNEAISSKVKSAFNNAVAKIRELFAKFMEKLRANVTSTKNYLDKYKKYILGTTINSDYRGKDIINGMYRVMNYTIPAFDFQSISNNGGLDSPQAFFNQHLKPKTDDSKVRNGNQPNVVVDGSDQALSQIGEWFKQWFGCSGNDVDLLATTLQSSIKDIYDFMYDISKIEESINDSIKNIEGLRERALKQTGVEITNQPQQQGTQESFTYLDHYPVLLEIDKAPTTTTNNNNQSAPTNYTGATARQMTNVDKTGVEKNGQEQYGVGQTVKEEVDAKCNVYIQTVTKVLQAKLTAVEFLRNEFMTLFRELVQRNVEGNADPSGNATNNTARMPGAAQPRQ